MGARHKGPHGTYPFPSRQIHHGSTYRLKLFESNDLFHYVFRSELFF